MKKKLLALAAIMICVSIVSLGTVAYFNAEQQAHNIITTGSIDIDLVEEMIVDGTKVPFEDQEGVMPGESVSKIVTVKNTGEADAYIRVWVNTAISEPGDPITNPLIKNLPLTIEVEGETVELIDIDYNTEDWEQGEDGYWYYGKALKAGETTEPLFENVTFHKLMGNAYQNSRTIVDVSAEATQADNNGTSAMTAAGWPET